MKENYIQTVEQPTCPVCSDAGTVAYNELKDRMFGAAGSWRLRICSSKKCGTLWLDPKPLAADISKAYINYYTHSDNFVPDDTSLRRLFNAGRAEYLENKYFYPKAKTVTVGVFRRFCSRVLHLYPLVKTASQFSVMYLPFRSNGSVLEVGCGSGYLLSNLKAVGWKNVKGLDFDSVAVEFARSKGLDVDCGGLDDTELPYENYDGVIMSHVIEHLYDPVDSLKRSFALLKPGGVMVLVTPNSKSFGRMLFGRNWRGLEPPRHLQVFSPNGLEELCIRVGFADVKARTTVRGAAGMFAESSAIARAEQRACSVSVTWLEQVMGRILQAVEMLVHPLIGDRGEELVVVALKPGDLR